MGEESDWEPVAIQELLYLASNGFVTSVNRDVGLGCSVGVVKECSRSKGLLGEV